MTKAFDAKPVSDRADKDSRLKAMRRKWESLRKRARALGRERNRFAHTFLSWHDGAVVREIGRPWTEQAAVLQSEDEALNRSLGELTAEIGQFTTELGVLLPFADDDQILVS